jgi:hypothetical protein
VKKLTAAQVAKVLEVARQEVGVTEEPPGTNAGPRVEEYLATVGLKKGNPWCAAFVCWVGHAAVGDDAWMPPNTGGCAALGDWAKREGVRMLKPKIGDIFLLYFPKLKRFAHTGFVAGPPDESGKWATVEGNTSGGGSREGWGTFEHRRLFGPSDRFIRLGP